MRERFLGKTIIVTGGGKGMGKASALAFAHEGGNVVIADIAAEEGQQTSEEIKNKGGESLFVRCDVSNSEEVRNLVAAALGEFGTIDVLFNNAGIQTYGFVDEMPEEDFDRVMAVNFKSMFLTCKYCIPEMKKRGRGAIVNNASVQGLASQRTVAAYAATKGAIISFTRALAVDHGEDNIRVNCIAPAGIKTPMLYGSAKLFAPDNPDGVIKDWGKPYPLGRIGEASEVANLVLFLCSDEASYCTGGCYLVDGGIMATLAAGI